MQRSCPLAALLLTGCLSGTPAPPSPQELSLASLLQLAEQDALYVPSNDQDTAVPFTAVITPPGVDIYYRSPPFGPAAFPNPDPGPRLNLLPGLVDGRFGPYVTVEMWTNDFGPVWVNPLYIPVQADGQGGYVTDSSGNPVQVGGPVYTTVPPDRFYSPFWQIYWVLVPASDVATIKAHPLTSTKAVLDSNYPQIEGALTTRSIIPGNVTLDPPIDLATRTDANHPTPEGYPASIPTGFADWMGVIARAEYSEKQLSWLSELQVLPDFAWWEGHEISVIHLGVDDFQELPGEVVQANPIFLWVNQKPDGSLDPAGLPNVLGTGPLFSEGAVTAPLWKLPQWASFWELYEVVTPAGSAPFYPVVDNTDARDPPLVTDVFGALRAERMAPSVSAAVSAIPNVARYAGRLATRPSCFADTSDDLQAMANPTPPPDGGMPNQITASQWAQSCGFLDSQQAIEAAIEPEDFIDTENQVLCQLQLWAEPQP